jgi:hypothetical protein
MAVALKAELHRLVESIPETHPKVANELIELMFLLVDTSREDERLFNQLVDEIDEIQVSATDPDDLMARLQDLRDRWSDTRDDADRLLQLLESAPEDDEPVTPEERAMLDARRASTATGSTISDDELGHLLQS